MNFLFIIITGFFGYAIGRVGHILGGHIEAGPDHWIYGLLLIILSLFFIKYEIGIPLLSFGTGVFISDFKDFLHLKFTGADEPGPKKFWGID